MKLADLDPHFLKRVAPFDYEYTDDIKEADGLQLKCPACHYARQTHPIILWRNPRWQFAGRGYKDATLVSDGAMVLVTACLARFYLKAGKVDFY